MTATEVEGRFLPSRVYSRWKWSVRSGLVLVPFIVLLTGGLILFLSTSIYRSTSTFSTANAPPPAELAELLKSRKILDLVVTETGMGDRAELDKMTAEDILLRNTQIRILPNTDMLEVAVSYHDRVTARDLAAAFPNALRQHLIHISEAGSKQKATEFTKLIQDATDTAEEKATELTVIQKIHGETTDQPPAKAIFQRARRASLLADAETERLNALKAQYLTQNIESEPRIIIHSSPQISDHPESPEIGPELNQLAIQSLIAGLLASLLLPYLFELAFPPHNPSPLTPEPIENL